MNSGDFDLNGFALVAQVLSAQECAQLASQICVAGAGTRTLLAQAWCAALAARLRAHPALAAFIAPDMVAVQCTYFEKSAKRNWLVPIHQDLSIPVAQRVLNPALSGWSLKEGTEYVRAPAEVLVRLVAVRLNLDPCAPEDGPLRVVSGSHAHGVVTDDEALALRAAGGETLCTAPVGSVLVLRPLLLHASSKGSGSSARRVLHFLFAPPELPHGLRWDAAV
jgi:ectoine hydroxylase-related dioxygenase (phytanoyl-CoA dioxygenase family)